jgi:cytochrome c553
MMRITMKAVARDYRLGSASWWSLVVTAWNESEDRQSLAGLGKIRFVVTNTNVAPVEVAWDNEGYASTTDEGTADIPSFSAAEEIWHAFLNARIRAIPAVFEGHIRYDGPIDRILPYAKQFDLLAKVAKRATFTTRSKSITHKRIARSGLLAMVALLPFASGQGLASEKDAAKKVESPDDMVRRGKYLTQIGVCEACHTPPAVPSKPPTADNDVARERRFRTDLDWVKYLDSSRRMAGGVPFLLRLSKDSSGVVYSRNITPDPNTGIGKWTDEQIVDVIRSGKRPDGTALFLFAPHSFFKNLALNDARAIVAYLRTLPPIVNPLPDRQLPFNPQAATDITPVVDAPIGRSLKRANYLTAAVVGCRECHSHTENGVVQDYTGGDATDSFIGVFRLGPDLALRPEEKGFSAFPYPGYAVLYGPNLTRFGIGGDFSNTTEALIVRAIRRGIAVAPDEDGRPDGLEHVMLWQFYKGMSNDDAFSLARFLKRLKYVHHEVDDIEFFGEDWPAAFKKIYHEAPSEHDLQLFGKATTK